MTSMRWRAFTGCPRSTCDGELEISVVPPPKQDVIDEEERSFAKPIYHYQCTRCDVHGEWGKLARSRRFRR